MVGLAGLNLLEKDGNLETNSVLYFLVVFLARYAIFCAILFSWLFISRRVPKIVVCVLFFGIRLYYLLPCGKDEFLAVALD